MLVSSCQEQLARPDQHNNSSQDIVGIIDIEDISSSLSLPLLLPTKVSWLATSSRIPLRWLVGTTVPAWANHIHSTVSTVSTVNPKLSLLPIRAATSPSRSQPRLKRRRPRQLPKVRSTANTRWALLLSQCTDLNHPTEHTSHSSHTISHSIMACKHQLRSTPRLRTPTPSPSSSSSSISSNTTVWLLRDHSTTLPRRLAI